MDMKQYMDKDLHHLESGVKDLSANITHWDTDKVFQKAKEMFDAFSHRFHLEDYLLCKITPNAQLCPGIEKFLKRRMELRAVLEDILTLHADEPDFREEIGLVIAMVERHIRYREIEFYPQVIDRLPAADLERMEKALAERVQVGKSV
jgi:hypothetical protein